MNIFKGFINRLPATLSVESPEQLLLRDWPVIQEWQRRVQLNIERRQGRRANVARLRINKARRVKS